ncbi:hypothetical protein ACP4OV_010369 [Aristida adscensionis]
MDTGQQFSPPCPASFSSKLTVQKGECSAGGVLVACTGCFTMVEVAIAAVGWFLAPNIKLLMDWAYSRLGDKYAWYSDLKEKLQQLAEDLDSINGIVVQASASFTSNPEATKHLWRLTDAISDTEGFLDAFQLQIIGNANKKWGLRPVIGNRELLKEAEKLIKQLKDLSKKSPNYLRHLQPPSSRGGTGPLPELLPHTIFGYFKEYEDLVSKLNGCDDAKVVAIIGHGGMGKTELARRAFHDKQQLEFDNRIWVSVYGMFRVEELLREIWKSVSKGEPGGGMNVTSLQDKIKEKVKSQKCLLVLDDVCNDESVDDEQQFTREDTWATVLAPFKREEEGARSRILMTTRAKICSDTLGVKSDARIILNGFDTEGVKCLIKYEAFGQNAPEGIDDALRRTVTKLRGSPLAAKDVGSKLKAAAKDQVHLKWKVDADSGSTGSSGGNHWQEILNKHCPTSVLKAHQSGFHDLPPQLQRCFAFCSIFPKNWRFQKEKLIRMWVALGFIRDDGKAKEVFAALLQRSLFHELPPSTFTAISGRGVALCYGIQEHIHSMLRQVAPGYYLAVDGSTGTGRVVPPTVRHLSVTASCLDKLLEKSVELKRLWTLLIFSNKHAAAADSSITSSCLLSADNVKSLLQKFQGLRVFDVSDTRTGEVPESIGKLKHLRYLGLPAALVKLPSAGITKLLLLRYLDAPMGCIAQIASIGSLEMLQGSVEFHAGSKVKGHDMGQLGKLNSLRGVLSIKGLERVQSKQEALSARLEDKEYLTVLKLEWSSRNLQEAKRSVAIDSDVLEGLRPHQDLQSLHIEGYLGKTLPGWLADCCMVHMNLRSLHLSNCNQLLALPRIGGDGNRFLHLRKVEILDCKLLSSLSGLESLGASLTYLSVERCQAAKATFRYSSFPLLSQQNLHILGCEVQFLRG